MNRLVALMALVLAIAGCDAPPEAAGPGPHALSMLEPAAGGLRWVRVDPDKAADQRSETIADLPDARPGDSGTAQVAWSPDGKRGLVWIDPGYARAQAPAWEVDLATHAVTAVSLPGPGTPQDVGYDAEGRLVSLNLDLKDDGPFEPRRDAKGPFLMHAGKRYDVPADREGIPLLAFAMRRGADGAWSDAETVVTDTGWDYAMGVNRLETRKILAPRTKELLDTAPAFAAVEDQPTLAKLKAVTPKEAQESDEWETLKGVPLFAWAVSGEFVHLTGRLAYFDAQGAPKLLPGSSDELATPVLKNDVLLVSDLADGGNPRLYTLESQSLTWSSSTAKAAVFWPAPAPAKPRT